jgi:hypothetical protein
MIGMLRFIRRSIIDRLQVCDHNTVRDGSRRKMPYEQPGPSRLNEIDIEIVRLLRLDTNSTMIYEYFVYKFYNIVKYG